MGFLKGKGLSRQELLGSITYFDMLVGLVALASAGLVLANGPGWVWSYKDALGLGLFLGTILVFLLLRRRVSAQSMLWLRVWIAVSTVAAGVVLFRRWDGLWLGVGALLLLFALCLRSKTALEGLAREDISRVLLIVGSLLFATLLAEGTLRLFPALLPEGARTRLPWRAAVVEPWHVAHPYIGHLHNIEYLRRIKASTSPKTVEFWPPARFDAWGFRNTEPWPERVDILTLGDSLTYGFPVSDTQTWPALLERDLAPRHILNLGLVSATPQQYLRVYETFGARVSPKMLVVGLLLGNDLTDALSFDAWWRGERHETFQEAALIKGQTGVNGWLRLSYLSLLLDDLRASYKAGPALQRKTVQLTDGSRMQLDLKLLARQQPLAAPGQLAFTLVLQTLEHLCTLAAQQQTHCLVLLFPGKEEVYLPLIGGAAVDLAAPLLPELAKRGLAYLDLGPHFRQRAAAGEALFEEVGVHPNARGYALIAEVVRAHLQAHAARYGLD